MTVDEAVAALDALTDDDPEVAHGSADKILLEFVNIRVALAWDRAAKRVGFWYA